MPAEAGFHAVSGHVSGATLEDVFGAVSTALRSSGSASFRTAAGLHGMNTRPLTLTSKGGRDGMTAHPVAFAFQANRPYNFAQQQACMALRRVPWHVHTCDGVLTRRRQDTKYPVN